MYTKELAAFLLAQDPNAKVVLLSQFDQPIEAQLLGPVVRSELATAAKRTTKAEPSDVLLVRD